MAAAQLIDPNAISEDDEDQVAITPAAPTAPVVEDPQDDDTPAKYRGKSPAELLQVIRDQEAHIGRQAHEVGTLRQLADKALALTHDSQSRTAVDNPGNEEDLDSGDFFQDPQGAVTRATAKATAPVVGRLEQLERAEQQRAFLAQHPTAMQDTSNPDFVKWVTANKARTRLAQQAIGNPEAPNFELAGDLWELWEERKAEVAARAEPADPAPSLEDPPVEQRTTTPKAPSTPKAPTLLRGGSDNGPSGGSTNARVFSRTKLLKMQIEKPDDYWDPEFQAELKQAYVEKRVK